jgi:hypothetical protein
VKYNTLKSSSWIQRSASIEKIIISLSFREVVNDIVEIFTSIPSLQTYNFHLMTFVIWPIKIFTVFVKIKKFDYYRMIDANQYSDVKLKSFTKPFYHHNWREAHLRKRKGFICWEDVMYKFFIQAVLCMITLKKSYIFILKAVNRNKKFSCLSYQHEL